MAAMKDDKSYGFAVTAKRLAKLRASQPPPSPPPPSRRGRQAEGVLKQPNRHNPVKREGHHEVTVEEFHDMLSKVSSNSLVEQAAAAAAAAASSKRRTEAEEAEPYFTKPYVSEEYRALHGQPTEEELQAGEEESREVFDRMIARIPLESPLPLFRRRKGMALRNGKRAPIVYQTNDEIRLDARKQALIDEYESLKANGTFAGDFKKFVMRKKEDVEELKRKLKIYVPEEGRDWFTKQEQERLDILKTNAQIEAVINIPKNPDLKDEDEFKEWERLEWDAHVTMEKNLAAREARKMAGDTSPFQPIPMANASAVLPMPRKDARFPEDADVHPFWNYYEQAAFLPQAPKISVKTVIMRSNSMDRSLVMSVHRVIEYMKAALDHNEMVEYLVDDYCEEFDQGYHTGDMAHQEDPGPDLLQMWIEGSNVYHLVDGKKMIETWGAILPQVLESKKNLDAILGKVSLQQSQLLPPLADLLQIQDALYEEIMGGVMLNDRLGKIRVYEREEGGELVESFNAQNFSFHSAVVHG